MGGWATSFPAPPAVLPDGFRQNARENCQNARKNAPAYNVKIFIAFLDVSEGYKNQSSKMFLKNAKNSQFYVVKFDNLQNAPNFWLFAQCAKALSKCARGGARCAIFAQLRKIWQHCPPACDDASSLLKDDERRGREQLSKSGRPLRCAH